MNMSPVARAGVVGLCLTMTTCLLVLGDDVATGECDPHSPSPTCADDTAPGGVVVPVARNVWMRSLDPSALSAAQARLDEVLDHLSDVNRTGLLNSDVQVHVIPRDLRLTDLSPWSHLQGTPAPGGAGLFSAQTRTYDEVRGLGPDSCSPGALEIAIGEEQLVPFVDGLFPSPDRDDLGRNLVHEMGHAVECSLTEPQRQALATSYSAARQGSSSDVVGDFPAYTLSSEREYFAEGTAAWFDSNVTTSYSRSWLRQHDPALHDLLATVFQVPPAVPRCAGERATRVLTANDGSFAGTPGRDVIVGSDGPDVINGGGGDDVVCAGGGDDSVHGGYGNDALYGDAGNDVLVGGVGNDVVTDADGADRLLGGAGNDLLDATDGETTAPDELRGSGPRTRCRHDPDDQVVGC